MLRLNSVNVSYGAIQAVRDVSIEVPKGEVVTIIGANGAGKSTLLKSIVGLEPVTNGQVFFDGQDITSTPAHRRTGLGVALSPEGRGVFSDQSVRDNLLLGAYSKKADAIKTEQKIEHFFGLFPRLRERQEQFAGTLSGGEQQMLAIARALAGNPTFVMLDEPSQGLAPLLVRELGSLMMRLRQTGLTILLVEQNIRLALAVADHVLVLHKGTIVFTGSADEFRNREEALRGSYLAV
jgi:branched-chain amino acid transport system ATP-binding protein